MSVTRSSAFSEPPNSDLVRELMHRIEVGGFTKVEVYSLDGGAYGGLIGKLDIEEETLRVDFIQHGVGAPQSVTINLELRSDDQLIERDAQLILKRSHRKLIMSNNLKDESHELVYFKK